MDFFSARRGNKTARLNRSVGKCNASIASYIIDQGNNSARVCVCGVSGMASLIVKHQLHL